MGNNNHTDHMDENLATQLRGMVRRIATNEDVKATAMQDEIDRLRQANYDLTTAISGGGSVTTAEMIEFLADRLVNQYGENENIDFIRSARERAKKLRATMYGGT